MTKASEILLDENPSSKMHPIVSAKMNIMIIQN
jgi:hypothetical protein